jgi:hypothetical protein
MRKAIIATFVGFFIFIVLGVSIYKLGLGNHVQNFILNIRNYDGSITRIQLLNLAFMILLMFSCSILGFFLSKRKGRDKFAWGVLCFFFNVWALILLWFLPGSKTSSKNMKGI